MVPTRPLASKVLRIWGGTTPPGVSSQEKKQRSFKYDLLEVKAKFLTWSGHRAMGESGAGHRRLLFLLKRGNSGGPKKGTPPQCPQDTNSLPRNPGHEPPVRLVYFLLSVGGICVPRTLPVGPSARETGTEGGLERVKKVRHPAVGWAEVYVVCPGSDLDFVEKATGGLSLPKIAHIKV